MLTLSPLNAYIQNHPHPPSDLSDGKSIPTLTVEWDRADELVWTIRLVEFFGDGQAAWSYQPAAEWTPDGNGGFSYENVPPAAGGKIAGSCSAHVQLNENTTHFRLSLRNGSEQPWPDCWGWVCLIHRWAKAFQANCELPAGAADKPWVNIGSLEAPMERWLKWCPIEEKLEAAKRIGKNAGARWQPHIQAQEGSVRAWRVEGNQQQFIELTSPDAVILGWSHWPCTDMGLNFGTIEPGEENSVSGELSFREEEYIPT